MANGMPTTSRLLRWMFAISLTMMVAASAIMVIESHRDPRRATRSREFQQLFGGLGFGPAVDLSRCSLAFDPRLGPVCDSRFGPIAGGGSVCPHHALAIFDYSELVDQQFPQSKATLDAAVP